MSFLITQTAAVWVVRNNRVGWIWGRGAVPFCWVMTSQHLHGDRCTSTMTFPNYHKWHSVSELPPCSLTPGVLGSSGGPNKPEATFIEENCLAACGATHLHAHRILCSFSFSQMVLLSTILFSFSLYLKHTLTHPSLKCVLSCLSLIPAVLRYIGAICSP